MLILIRHGRTDANRRQLLQGHLDNPLDDVGRSQAAQIARRIGHIDRLVSSPLLRARETSEFLTMPFEIDNRWIEVNFGDYDGLPLSSISSTEWHRWRTDATFAPPSGESQLAVFERVQESCTELSASARSENIAIVSHVSPIKAAIAWALGVPSTVGLRCRLDVASVSRIEIGPNGPSLISFNERLFDS